MQRNGRNLPQRKRRERTSTSLSNIAPVFIKMNSPNILNIKGSRCSLAFNLNPDRSIISSRKWTGKSLGLFKKAEDQVVVHVWGQLPPLSGDDNFVFDELPSVMVSWIDSRFDFSRLLGKTVEIRESFDKKRNYHASWIYLYGHMDFDDLRMTFIEQDGDHVRIRMTGSTVDVHSRYDERMLIDLDTIIRKS